MDGTQLRVDSLLHCRIIGRGRRGQWWDIQSPANGHRPDVKDVPFDYVGIDRLRDTLLLHESNWRQFFEATQITPLKAAYED